MPAPHHSVFTGRMPFLPPNQQRQSTEGSDRTMFYKLYIMKMHSAYGLSLYELSKLIVKKPK